VGRSVAPLTRRLLAAGLVAGVVGAAAVVLITRDVASTGSGIRLTYAVEDLTTRVRTTEVVEVDGPLRSRRLTGSTGSATTERGVFDRRDGRWRQVAITPPGEVGQDLRLSSALAWAADQRLAARDGTGTVAGKPCTWWLTREPLDIASVAPATSVDRTRSCVDADGRLLADTWRAGGRDLRRRTATEIRRVRPDVLDGMAPEPLPAALRLTAVETLVKPVDDLVVLTPPAGWELLTAARFSELEPGTTEVRRRTVRAIYASGTDVMVVDQIRGPGEAPGQPILPVPALGTGHVQATGGGLVVTIPLGVDERLRVRTSVAIDDVAEWLQAQVRR
jgi:hypothetical protein